MDKINEQLTQIADYHDDLKELRTRHELTAKTNAEVSLQLSHLTL
jgi:hypothetical protein